MNKSLIKRMKEERFSRVSIDLFSGPGGLCTGFKWAGILPLVAVEWTDTTVETYSVTHNAEVFELSEYMKDGKADANYLKKFLKESTIIIFRIWKYLHLLQIKKSRQDYMTNGFLKLIQIQRRAIM